MKQALLSKVGVAAVVAMMLAGCATTPAPDFGGRWKPVNRFANSTMEIPLYTNYVYQATPMDGTLKTMLERWAKDAGMTLDYRLSSDYTLYGAVSRIGTTNPQEAMTDVTAAYAMQGVSVSIVGNSIVVQAASSVAAPTASSASAPHQGGS
ncbi:TcpQ domain-containing protein [Stenotrophomonas sp. YIM B06876]|uniref:TcpQ domain-containing protein n=1 Tax=Stenotrophomonas sp. YIM B06876 TaxID=3060211 RepID=UPI0027395EA1|nr:TcpQ domain-containing protein [Stenotrophomonas sp. YIM B06876]